MFLKSLTLRGFKSFADKTVLEFEPGVTVVVGPNGSGKSNLVDAVAWVLGAQGPRTLRGGKMDDVIFAGTPDRPALGRAEVSLTHRQHRRACSRSSSPRSRSPARCSAPVTPSTRSTARPAGCSTSRSCSPTPGIGRQQHVIVGQGQLDAVLNARPEDRRAIIEEAAGILKFRKRRERAERRLEATEGNLLRLNDLLREVRRQLTPLQRQADAARRHGGLVEELRAIRLHLAGHEIARPAGADRAAARRSAPSSPRARPSVAGPAARPRRRGARRRARARPRWATTTLADCAGAGRVAARARPRASPRSSPRSAAASSASSRRRPTKAWSRRSSPTPARCAASSPSSTTRSRAGARRAGCRVDVAGAEADAARRRRSVARRPRRDAGALACPRRRARPRARRRARRGRRASTLAGVDGVVGPLVDHLEIDAGAEAAVAAALGDAMRAVVVRRRRRRRATRSSGSHAGDAGALLLVVDALDRRRRQPRARAARAPGRSPTASARRCPGCSTRWAACSRAWCWSTRAGAPRSSSRSTSPTSSLSRRDGDRLGGDGPWRLGGDGDAARHRRPRSRRRSRAAGGRRGRSVPRPRRAVERAPAPRSTARAPAAAELRRRVEHAARDARERARRRSRPGSRARDRDGAGRRPSASGATLLARERRRTAALARAARRATSTRAGDAPRAAARAAAAASRRPARASAEQLDAPAHRARRARARAHRGPRARAAAPRSTTPRRACGSRPRSSACAPSTTSSPTVALDAPAPEVPEGTTLAGPGPRPRPRAAAHGPDQPARARGARRAARSATTFLQEQLEDVKASRRELNARDPGRRPEIVTVFERRVRRRAAEHFTALFTTLFPGGVGQAASLTDPDDLLNTGIEMEARPSGKNVRRLSLLSGGERSLTALAFLFARVPRPAVALLPDGRGRGRARRREPAPLPRPRARVPRRGAAADRVAPEAHDGGGRLPLRRVDAAGRLEPGREPARARRACRWPERARVIACRLATVARRRRRRTIRAWSRRAGRRASSRGCARPSTASPATPTRPTSPTRSRSRSASSSSCSSRGSLVRIARRAHQRASCEHLERRRREARVDRGRACRSSTPARCPRRGARSGPRRSARCCAASSSIIDLVDRGAHDPRGARRSTSRRCIAGAGIAGVALGFGAQSLVRDFLVGHLHAHGGPVRRRRRDRHRRRHRHRRGGEPAHDAAARRRGRRVARPQRRDPAGRQQVAAVVARGRRRAGRVRGRHRRRHRGDPRGRRRGLARARSSRR